MAAAVVAAAEVAAAVVIDMYCTNKSRILLQFHITGRCNLRCKHCYRTEGDVEALSYDDIVMIIEQFKTLREHYNAINGISRRGHINITGGEPFFRKDIKEILRFLGENKEHFSYGILSNGSFIDDETIGLLKETEVSFVQLSIDGDRETHDFLRADGDYDRVMKTAEWLEKNGIKTYISFTANKDNMYQLPLVAKECRKRKITKLWSDRLVPLGNGENLSEILIDRETIGEYIDCLKKARGNVAVRSIFKKTQVTMNRALQFQNSDGEIYSCSAGDTLITVDEFGNIMPCRRMPVIRGNVFESTLTKVYFNDETFNMLRMKGIPAECKECRYCGSCMGGARCQSYALLKSFLKADPACPLIRK